MKIHLRYYSFKILLIGLFLLPIFIGSVASLLALAVSLIWLLSSFLSYPNKNEVVPRFQVIWTSIGVAFFALFAISSASYSAIIFGFNTFAFILSLGVLSKCQTFDSRWLIRGVYFSLMGLFVGLIWSLFQHNLLGIDRITAYVGGGSNLVARISILLATFSALLLLMNVKIWLKLLSYIFAVSASAFIIIYSGSRGALITLPLLIALPIIFALPKNLLKSVWVWSCLFISGLSVIGFIYYLDPNGLVTSTLDRLHSVATGVSMDRSTELRYQMWQVSFWSFLEHPIIGTGWHSFVAVTQNTILAEYASGNKYFNFHSDIANFAVAGGIVGLLLYFLLLFAPIIFWDTPKDHSYFRVRLYWAVTMPILYLVLGLTDMVMGFDYPTMFYAFSFAIIWGLTEHKTELEH